MSETSEQIHRSPIRTLIVLYVGSFIILSATSYFLRSPGYMDAEYYFLGSVNLARGNGFSEMILWNYLDDPVGLPHPSHTYWMPLPSIIAASGLVAFQSLDFFYAKLPYIFLAALIPPLTFIMSLSLYRDRRKARLSGILALFPGYYLVYLSLPETFTPQMILGAIYLLFLISLFGDTEKVGRYPLIIFFGGVVCGLLNLNRTDNLIFFFVTLIIICWEGFAKNIQRNGVLHMHDLLKALIPNLFILIAGYSVVMIPWVVRNYLAIKAPFSPAGTKTLWLIEYNQTFIYPSGQLNFSNWAKFGITENLLVRGKALVGNLKTLVAVESEIILLPFVLIAVIKQRKQRIVKQTFFLWILTLLVMSFIFPFAGERGGFLHSSAAFQPFIWAVTPFGFERILAWGAKKRNWEYKRAFGLFQSILLIATVGLSFYFFYTKVIGQDLSNPAWQQSTQKYAEVEAIVSDYFPDKSDIVMVNNPPGYYLASGGRPAVVIPDGDEDVLREVINRYRVSVLLIDANIVVDLKSLYQSPRDLGWLIYLETVDSIHIFQVVK